MLLNASGCLDGLTAPDTARQLDAFQHGGTRGSPVSPLLYSASIRDPAWAAPGRDPAPPNDIVGVRDTGRAETLAS